MLFAKNKKISLPDLKAQEPEAYTALVEGVKTELNIQESEAIQAANKTIDELTIKLERYDINNKITNYGKELQVSNVAEECIKENFDFNTSLVKLVDAHIEKVKSVGDSFDDSASVAAGQSADVDNSLEGEPQSFTEAITMIKKRDNISVLDAAKKAQVEFKDLFDAMYPEKDA